MKAYSTSKDGIDFDNVDKYTEKAFEELTTHLSDGISDAESRAFDIFKESLNVYIR